MAAVLGVVPGLILPGRASAAAYEPGVGELGLFKFESQSLSDRMNLRVNLANGNVLLRLDELSIKGTGLDLGVGHVYNSLDRDVSRVGEGWSMSVGPDDVRLVVAGDGSVTYLGSGGFRAPFAKNADGSFRRPTGLNADLAKLSNGTYRLKFRADGGRFEFSSAGTLTALADRNNNRIVPGYVSSRMSQLTDTQGRVVTLTYGTSGASNGKLVAMQDSTGRRYSYAYSSTGTLSSVTDPAGKLSGFSYDTSGNLTQVASPGGNITKITYDGSRRATRIVRVDNPAAGTGPSTTFAYNAGNTVVTDPRGKATTHYYDSENRVIKALDALGNFRSRTYTSNSDAQNDTDEFSAVSKNTYDTDSRRMSSEQPAAAGFSTGLKTSFTYGADPQSTSYFYPKSMKDTQGSSTTMAYDAAGNVTSLTNQLPAQNVTRFYYNTNGTLAKSTDARGTGTGYSYDVKGNLTRIDRPAPLSDEVFVPDALSRVTSATDGKGQLTRYEYDTLDRTTKITHADGAVFAFTYDANGNVTARTSPEGTTTYVYDRLNRLTQTTLPADKRISYSYDAAGNLASVQLPDAASATTYAYGSTNLLSQMTEPGAKTTTFAYDKAGRRTSTTYPNGVKMAEVYDTPGRLKSITATRGATTLTDFKYTYVKGADDTNLRQTRINNAYLAGGGARTTKYTYDALNRLTRAQDTAGGSADYQYQLDGNSNVTQRVIPGQTQTYAYNSANQLCWRASGAAAANCAAPPSGAVSYAYDANGNVTQGGNLGFQGASEYGYNAADQMTRFRANPFFGFVEYRYLSPGQAERSKIGDGQEISSVLGLGKSASQTFGRDNAGRLVSQRTPSTESYFLFDGLGSVVATTDASGNLASCHDYEPYGDTRGTGCASGGSITTPAPWGFAGQQYDSFSGMYKMGERYYEPAIGRWTQQDPLDRPGDLREGNRYAYVGADPINLIDPTGTVSCSTFGLGGACKKARKVLKNKTFRSGIKNFGCTAAGLTAAAGGTAAAGPGGGIAAGTLVGGGCFTVAEAGGA